MKFELKRIDEIGIDELARIATPAWALNKLAQTQNTPAQRIDGLHNIRLPKDALHKQVQNGDLVLVSDSAAPVPAPGFVRAGADGPWNLATTVHGPARTTWQQRLHKLHATARVNRPPTTGGAGGSVAMLGAAPATPRPATLGPHEAGSATPTPAHNATTSTPSIDGPPEEKCTTEGEPISMTSGEELLSLDDAALPGPVPFVWRRTYRTSHSRDMGLGHGWVHPGASTLTVLDATIELIADDGRRIVFARPALGHKSRHLHEGMTLEYVSPERLVLSQPGQPTKIFTRHSENGFRLTQWRHAAYASESNGFALNFHYGSHDQLERVHGNWGKGLYFERETDGRIRAVYQLNHAGEKLHPAVARYDYDDAGDLIAHRNAAGHGERYRYENHILVRRTLASGYNFYFEWDQHTNAAKCLRQWGDHGNYAYTFEWDAPQGRSAATNSRGHTTRYRYNAFGLITEKIDPEGHIHRTHYNDAGQAITHIDPLGHKTEFLYDDKQRLRCVIDALGQRQRHGYLEDQLVYVTDAAGNTWERRYNERGLLAALTSPTGSLTRYEYTPTGLLSQITDPAGRATRFQWNERAELAAQTDPLGNTLHYHYDDWGRVIRVVAQAAGQALSHAERTATHYEYTAVGLIAKITHAAGQTSRFAYNENGQLTQYTDPHGRTTTYRYDDGLSQPTARIDPAGHRISYEYDTERNLIALINENGDRHQFVYDANERLIQEIGFDGRLQQYHYNPAGHLTQHLDSGEVIHEFERDALGRLLTKTSRSVRGEEAERSRYRYDALGRLIETYNEHQYLQFAYDPLGNLVHEIHCDLNEQRERVLATEQRIAHQYNALGQRIQTVLPDGQRIDYTFDASLGFASVSLNDHRIAAVTRDTLGRERSRTQGALSTHSEYDPQGRLSRQRAIHRDTQHRPIARDYGYDPHGNINYFKDGHEEIRYVYDTLNRLTHAATAAAEFFAFDPAGNLLSITDDLPAAPGLVKGNRLLLQGDKKFEYDARGNLVRETRGQGGALEQRYSYTLSNQLAQVTSTQRDHNISFKYDPLGRRIEKRDAFGSTCYLWTDNLLAQETRNQIRKTYLYEPASFRPLAQIENGTVYHYHLDHLGTPRELTNETGKIVWKARYKTYGSLALKEVEEVENNLRFQGQYFDEETGLHYNRHRYYNPNTGQFIHQDPIGLLGGFNTYQYAPNPTGWIDPLGLSCKEQGYKTTPLKADYIGENDPSNLCRWNAPNTVKYLSETEKLQYELEVHDGLLVNKSTGIPFDSFESDTFWGGAIFIMDAQGRIFASNYQKPEFFHHSSLSSGNPVASAGTLQVAHGRLLEVSNQSGHYAPSQTLNNQLFAELENRGMAMDALDKVERSGWKDDGSPLVSKPHKKFRDAENWSPGEDIPDDWAEF
ncbi:MAG: RHS repeat-associated core domain-containing protein [Pseudomonadota bacterium]